MREMPLGDQRNIVREYRGSDGETAVGYWSGNGFRLAPVADDARPLGFIPVTWRELEPPSDAGGLISTEADHLSRAIVELVNDHLETHGSSATQLQQAVEATGAAMASIIVGVGGTPAESLHAGQIAAKMMLTHIALAANAPTASKRT